MVDKIQVLLVGDTGGLKPGKPGDVTEDFFYSVKQAYGEKVNVMVLGDLVYPRGLPKKTDKGREAAEAILQTMLQSLSDFSGTHILLLGNHDWNKGRQDGYARGMEMSEWLNFYKSQNTLVVFSSGGLENLPFEILEVNGLSIFCLDTQRLVTKTSYLLAYGLPKRKAFLEHTKTALDAALKRYSGRPVLVLGHHPFYSGALHGGRFSTRHHFFPLTALHKRLYLPVPFAGSLYPAYRAAFGASEDMSHKNYRQMRHGLGQVMSQYKNLVYAAGHDHNLQAFDVAGNLYLVSGSGSKTAKVYSKKHQIFKAAVIGGFMLTYQMASGSVLVEALDAQANLLFATTRPLGLETVRAAVAVEN